MNNKKKMLNNNKKILKNSNQSILIYKMSKSQWVKLKILMNWKKFHKIWKQINLNKKIRMIITKNNNKQIYKQIIALQIKIFLNKIKN